MPLTPSPVNNGSHDHDHDHDHRRDDVCDDACDEGRVHVGTRGWVRYLTGAPIPCVVTEIRLVG